MQACRHRAGPLEVRRVPALEGHRRVALLVARYIGADLDVDLVDPAHELRPLGEAHELDAGRGVGCEVGVGDVEHDLVLTGDLPEPAVLGEAKGRGVALLDPAPERREPEPGGVLRQGLVQRGSDSLPPVLGQHARHRVEAAGDRRGTADAAAERLVAPRRRGSRRFPRRPGSRARSRPRRTRRPRPAP